MARLIAFPLALVLGLTACGSDDGTGGDTPTDSQQISFRERMTTIDDAVSVWADADSIEIAHAAAEAAANLVAGEAGPGYGDRDGNGVIDGATEVGVLPGVDGTPVGLAAPLADNQCIVDDVLGGSWDDPAARWETMNTAIEDWSPENNTMPSLPSHPMRLIGWATFTLDTDSLEETREHGGRAQLHVDVSLGALDCDE